MQRNTAQERDLHGCRRLLGAAVGEDLGAFAAFRAGKPAHVLDETENRHVDATKHVQSLARVDERDVLGRGHDDGATERHALRHGELHVPGAWRHVDQQHVQFTPFHVPEQLLQRALDHGPAPDHRALLVHHEPDGHDLDSVAGHRSDALPVDGLRPPGDPHEARLRRPVDVRVQDAHAKPLSAQGQGEVGRDRRLADAALAAGDGDDRLDAGERDRPRVRRRSGGCLRRAFGGQHCAHRCDAGERQHRLFAGAANNLEGLGPGRIGLQGEGDVAVPDGDFLHHPETHDILVAGWILDAG